MTILEMQKLGDKLQSKHIAEYATTSTRKGIDLVALLYQQLGKPKTDVIQDYLLNCGVTFKDGFYIKDNKLITEKDINKDLTKNAILKESQKTSILKSIQLIDFEGDTDYHKMYRDNLPQHKPATKNALFKALIDRDLETILLDMVYHKTEYMLWLYGIGEAGKSLIARVFKYIYGVYQKTSTLEQMGGNFGLHSMLGSLMLVGDDLGSESVKSNAGSIKSAITGNEMSVNIKYRPQVDLSPVCNILFNCNVIPYVDMKDDGIMRRLMIKTFEKKLNVDIFFDDNEVLELMLKEIAVYLVQNARPMDRQEFKRLNKASQKYYFSQSAYVINFNILVNGNVSKVDKLIVDGTYAQYLNKCKDSNNKPSSKNNWLQIIKNHYEVKGEFIYDNSRSV